MRAFEAVLRPQIISVVHTSQHAMMTKDAAVSRSTLETAFVSDVGRVRELNEDSGWAQKFDSPLTNRWHLTAALLVADGMGGHEAGEVASGLASETAWHIFVEGRTKPLSPREETGEKLPQRVAATVADINRAVHEETGRQAPEGGARPGTTFTLALLRDDEYFIGHLGDSRAYHIGADASVQQISEDHSFVAEAVRRGLMSPAQAKVSPYRNQITRAMGLESEVEPEVYQGTWRDGETILLCSDGLSEHVQAEEIGQIVEIESNLQRACEKLVTLANKRGGHDNITIAAARKKGTDASTGTPGGATESEDRLQNRNRPRGRQPWRSGILDDNERARRRRERRRKNNTMWLAGLLLFFGLVVGGVLWARRGPAPTREKTLLSGRTPLAANNATNSAKAGDTKVNVEIIIKTMGREESLLMRSLQPDWKIAGRDFRGDSATDAEGQMSTLLPSTGEMELWVCRREDCSGPIVRDMNPESGKIEVALSSEELYFLCGKEEAGKSQLLMRFRLLPKQTTT